VRWYREYGGFSSAVLALEALLICAGVFATIFAFVWAVNTLSN
jgi:hypothetical protein